jgi:hypothetical protein
LSSTTAAEQEHLDQEQLLSLKESRSLIAEASLVIELYARGKVTSIFTAELLQQAQDQLNSAASKLPADSHAALMIKQALGAMLARNASELSSIAGKLSELDQSR